MKIWKQILAWTLTCCLLIAPFSGSLVFALGSAPDISFNISEQEYVTADTVIQVDFTAQGDAALTACDTRLEGVSLGTDASISFTPAEKGLSNGVYTLVAEATDSEGETAIAVRSFVVVDKININFTYNENEEIVPSLSGATAGYYSVEPLDYSVYYASTQNGELKPDNLYPYAASSVHKMKYFNETLYADSVSGIPYQLFDVSLNGQTDGEVVVRYTGATHTGERIAIKVYNPLSAQWDTVGTIIGSDSVSEALDVATYADNDVIHVAAVLDYVTNGSDTMIWSTDPQHYTKFEDLYDYYYRIYQYAAEEYTAGNVGYIMTTGDIVDDRPNTAEAVKQWQVADQAMSYVDEVNMPNGLVSGNHDVGDYKKPDYSAGPNTVSDYSKFAETFPATRYNNKPWYGGSINNNTSHYDLVTIGNVDFIILHLGYGVEATPETIEWANQVLSRYSHRTALITTHQYLDAGAAVRDNTSRAELIFNEIIDPNPNVKAILCGHDDGSLCLEKTASDGRLVYEILSDYQFVEAEDPDFYENEHYIGSVPHCCGDGYIRLLTVKGSTLSNITYSPVTDRYNPYGDRENFSIDLNCDLPSRYIETVAFSAYVVGEEVENTATGDTAIVITGPDSTTYHHVSYSNFPQVPDDEENNTPVDLAALDVMIEEARGIDTTVYTQESVDNLNNAITTAEEIDRTSSDAVQTAYHVLANAIGELKLTKPTIDASTLQSLYKYDLSINKWVSADSNTALSSSSSHITATQTEAGGMHMTRSAASTNTWPSARYNTTNNIELKPVNGKIYVDLSVDADSSWCLYYEVEQGSVSALVRLNFAIENAFNNKDTDGFEGVFNGVYDVTKAFTENGLDPNATLTIVRSQLFIVPGDVTYDHIEFMTEISDAPLDTSALQALIDKIETMDETQYTASSWKALTKAVAGAKAVLNDTTAAQADINLATIELQKAKDKLKNIADIIPEPEGSLLPADEGLWVESAVGTMNIYRDDNNYTVLQNTNSQWPNATYTPAEPFTFDVATKQISLDMTVAGETSVLLNINGKWVKLNSYITTKLNSASDIQSGTYTADIPLSKITELANATNAVISQVRVFSVGAAASSAVTIRQLQVTDYTPPPYVEEVLCDLLPETIDDTTSPSETGSHEVLEDGTLVVHSPAEGYRVQIIMQNRKLYNMNILNAIRLNAQTDVPFKIAFHIGCGTDSTSKWLNTSEATYSHLFTVVDDRIIAGSYDVTMEAKDYCSGLTTRESVFMNSVTIVTTGEGTLTIKNLEAIAADTFVWDEDMTTYGPAATPDNTYYQHCAKNAPEVYKKVDILKAIGLENHHINTGWVSYGSQALGLNVDLSQTPYLYYSFAQPADSNFTFGLNNKNTNCPWLLFRDATGEGAYLNSGADNWDSYTNREQYTLVSETGCIDMRQFLYNKNDTAWTVNNVTFYNSQKKGVIISYMFFGSEPVKQGDFDKDGQVSVRDTLKLYQQVSGEADNGLTPELADFNGDGQISMIDALALYRFANGVGKIEDCLDRHPALKE